MSTSISMSSFQALKMEAKRRVRASAGLTHSQALDHIAVEHGFANWSLLARAQAVALTPKHQYNPPVAAAAPNRPFTLMLSGWVREQGRRGFQEFWHEYIPTKYSRARYARARWFPQGGDATGERKEHVEERLSTAKRVIHFMDAIDVRPSKAWSSLFRSWNQTPQGLDHSLVWLTEDRKNLVTTEPYIGAHKIEEIVEWCKAEGWTAALLPKGIGMWNPCRSDCNVDCSGHTQMLIMAPPKNGGDVNAAYSALVNIGPAQL